MSTLTAPDARPDRKTGGDEVGPDHAHWGSLGIFTKIGFDNRHVAECHSTSSIFQIRAMRISAGLRRKYSAWLRRGGGAPLNGRSPGAGVMVKDFGIRGFGLTYALFDTYELVILVARGGTPGSVYPVEPEPVDANSTAAFGNARNESDECAADGQVDGRRSQSDDDCGMRSSRARIGGRR